jgi:hypothetical protein
MSLNFSSGREALPPPAQGPARTVARRSRARGRPAARAAARLDPPAERVGPLRRGAHPQVQRRRGPETAAQALQRVVEERGAQRPVILEARPRAPRRQQQLERRDRGVGRHQHRLVVDRHDPLAPPHLLLDEVGEQVAAHRAHGVRGEPLALAGDQRRYKAERVQLRVRVRKRRPGSAALVHEQVPARRRGVRAQPLAPDLQRGGQLLGRQVGERGDGARRVHDHLVRTARRLRGEEVRVRLGRRYGRVRLERRVQVGHDAQRPARPVRLAALGADGMDLGRRAILVALEERVGLGIDRLRRLDGVAVAGPRGASGGDDRLQPRQRVDADLVHR